METDAEMMARHGRLLAGFAEQAASLAADLHATALAAATPEEKQATSLAFHRMGRALRMTVALEAKLRRDTRADQRAEQAWAAEAESARRGRRKAELRAQVARMVFSEYEPGEDEAAEVLERLDAMLDAEAEIEGFLAQDLAGQLARLCAAIGYQPPASPPAADAPPPALQPDPGPSPRPGGALLPDHPFRGYG
ncbi:hypothetical protein [Phenylobacterium sp.]|uniref:hypothetical protein n=1 Tax=Phenylobacterium sp. TaxID=1871053 RepID=UPI00262795A0|nr:hypothetical protein [Phenylobacterium sp.]